LFIVRAEAAAPAIEKGDPNLSTDSKVIESYPLSSVEKNTLGIQHRNAYNLYAKKRYKDAYPAFSKLAEDYECNYLSAYWAGVTALKLKLKDEAGDWFDKAIEINPDYEPAIDARSKLK
jgi:TolA-binding protein